MDLIVVLISLFLPFCIIDLSFWKFSGFGRFIKYLVKKYEDMTYFNESF